MKKVAASFSSVILLTASGLFLLTFSVTGQEKTSEFPGLPDNINKIVSFSCVPCHTSAGGLMSREKLNFTKWTEYSTKKQKEKAEKMYSMLKKDAMPPKAARETRPDIIPTKDQVETIKKWAESLPSDDK